MACHNMTAIRKVGPGLQGIVGRKAGQMADMKYSSSLSSADWSWDEKNLALWLCDSKAAIVTLTGNPSASTKMPAQRVCDGSAQADLIAYLRTVK
ncbi:cytochrome C [Mariprofundus erugo]|uniref:Cytochrome C n=2 Tax=Mariprofundus erugo TaxID=2528639 RepID=A0A5R9GK01_9PROT|nr:cytochrome C [Mariprofundus erugo]TLS77374.1 cytochrome C [Mariprofundus erugo]